MNDLFSRFLYYFNQNFGITMLFYSLPGIVLALTIHEFSHALAAYIMGDKTAKNYGRLSLNPIAHLDPLGFLCLIVANFGWAKPVPVNDLNFRNRKKGMLVVSLAGPLSNFATALLLSILYRLFYSSMNEVAIKMFQIAYIINLNIGVFNLIPIPPLDGSNILDVFLTGQQKFIMRRYAVYSNVILLILVFSGVISSILGPVTGILNVFINFVTGMII